MNFPVSKSKGCSSMTQYYYEHVVKSGCRISDGRLKTMLVVLYDL